MQNRTEPSNTHTHHPAAFPTLRAGWVCTILGLQRPGFTGSGPESMGMNEKMPSGPNHGCFAGFQPLFRKLTASLSVLPSSGSHNLKMLSFWSARATDGDKPQPVEEIEN